MVGTHVNGWLLMDVWKWMVETEQLNMKDWKLMVIPLAHVTYPPVYLCKSHCCNITCLVLISGIDGLW